MYHQGIIFTPSTVHVPGLTAALTAQDEFGDENTSDSADEGDKLCRFLMVMIILR